MYPENFLSRRARRLRLRRRIAPISSPSHRRIFVPAATILSGVQLRARNPSLSLSCRPLARSHILALAHSGDQHGGTSRFHSPRGCAKRRLSRHPRRASQYPPESRWRYVFPPNVNRAISVTSKRERDRERERAEAEKEERIRACVSERENFRRTTSRCAESGGEKTCGKTAACAGKGTRSYERRHSRARVERVTEMVTVGWLR